MRFDSLPEGGYTSAVAEPTNAEAFTVVVFVALTIAKDVAKTTAFLILSSMVPERICQASTSFRPAMWAQEAQFIQ